MSQDIGDLIGAAVGRAAREAAQNIASNHRNGHSPFGRRGGMFGGRGGDNPLSGLGDSLSGGKGLAAGAGLVTLAPLAVKGASRLMGNGKGAVDKAKDKARGDVKDTVKDAGKEMLPGGGKGQPGVGKGRRMPIQQSTDVAVPIKTAYEKWTQYEEWPNFMHRLTNVSQEDDTHLSFKTKIWGKSKEFKAEIVDEQPCQRIKWEVTEGVSHTGVVTFHELADRLTRIEVNIDVQPGSLIEKAARGMRHVKRAVRADLHRFKAYAVMEADGNESEGDSDGGRQAEESNRPRSRAASSSSSRSRSRSGSSSSRSRSRSGSGSGSSSNRSRSASSSNRSRSASKPKSGSSSNRSRAASNGKTTQSGAKRSSGSSKTSRAKSGSRS